jgi:hypothetical protein
MGAALGGAAGVRRLGERRDYGPYSVTLGRCVHNDFHAWTLSISDSRFELEDLSDAGHSEQLPAGPDSHWVLEAGHGKPDPYNYPYEGLLDAINRRGPRGTELARVRDAWHQLQEWEPNGEILYRVVYVDCMAQPVALDANRGWKHRNKRFYTARMQAWEIIGVLAVDPDVLRAAQEAGATDERAVAWARVRGLLE